MEMENEIKTEIEFAFGVQKLETETMSCTFEACRRRYSVVRVLGEVGVLKVNEGASDRLRLLPAQVLLHQLHPQLYDALAPALPFLLAQRVDEGDRCTRLQHALLLVDLRHEQIQLALLQLAHLPARCHQQARRVVQVLQNILHLHGQRPHLPLRRASLPLQVGHLLVPRRDCALVLGDGLL